VSVAIHRAIVVAMRVEIRRQQLRDGTVLWRLTEQDGEMLRRWLPLEPIVAPLDRGGYTEFADARAFALGVDLIRAEAGLLGDLDARAVVIERAELDEDRRGRTPAPLPDLPAYEAA
jgi:hypothetical protein